MKISTKLFILPIIYIVFTLQAFAQTGSLNVHDPSSIIKDKNKYWIFSTGDDIYMSYSSDLYKWTVNPTGVFPNGSWPKWINFYVPGFAGIFWAPECIYMNGKFYLYYSCSLPYSPRSVIGLATNTTLDPTSPDYKWVDEGPVVRSIKVDEFNAIDPAVLKDDDGSVYLTYGSFHKGIAVVQLNPLTGKILSGNVAKKVAGYGPGEPDWEAAYMFKNDKYYYLVVNRADCCKNLESTYFMVVGRSESPFGPFVDDNNIDLRDGGGKHLLGTSGRFISPGHFGLMRENGANFVSMHFYDEKNLGKCAFDVANLKFNDGWPVITRDWITPGRYKVTNQNSGLVWDSYGCNGEKLEGIAQNGYNGFLCQKWDFAPLGNGVYKITCARGYGSVDALCNPFGSKMLTMTWLNTDCQKFKIDRAGDGSYLFTSMSTNKVVEVPTASMNGGTFLGLSDYSVHPSQRWFINKPGAIVGNNEAPMYVIK